MADAIGAAIAHNDLNELNRLVDAFCDAREWESLLALRDRARAAFDRGYQLWPAAAHAAYRLALEAPGEFAALVLDDPGGDFAFGPLPEVVASTHSFDDIAPHSEASPAFAQFAYERIALGEDLRGAEIPHAALFDVARFRCDWEPEYAAPVYRRSNAEFVSPDAIRGRSLGELGITRVADSAATSRSDCADAVEALSSLTRPWQQYADVTVRGIAVDGDAFDAVATLTEEPRLSQARFAALSAQDAMAWFVWAAASGGPHGRRRGLAAGRDAAWYALRRIAGFDDAEPQDPADLGESINEINWFWWQGTATASGWTLRIAAHDPIDNIGFAIDTHERQVQS